MNVQKQEKRVSERTELPRGAPREIPKQTILASNLRTAAYGHGVLNKLPNSDPLSPSCKIREIAPSRYVVRIK